MIGAYTVLLEWKDQQTCWRLTCERCGEETSYVGAAMDWQRSMIVGWMVRHHGEVHGGLASGSVRRADPVRGVEVCAGCGDRECFNVCCHPSNKQRAAMRPGPDGVRK